MFVEIEHVTIRRVFMELVWYEMNQWQYESQVYRCMKQEQQQQQQQQQFSAYKTQLVTAFTY